MTATLKQLVGEFYDSRGIRRRVGLDMDFVLLDGKAIATINRVPGAPIKLYGGVLLTPQEQAAVEDAIAASPRGKKPSEIRAEIQLPGELLDDEEGEVEGDDE